MKDLKELTRPNIWALKPYSSARDEYNGAEASVFLDANENPYNTPNNRYPDPMQRELKNMIAPIKKVDPDTIFLGNGSDEAIDLVYRAFCIPGVDNVVAIDPTYGMYQVCADVNDVEYRKVLLDENYQFSADKLLAATDDHTKLVFLCSPNNPTGNNLDRREMEKLLDTFQGLVIIDEAYSDFSDAPSFLADLDKYPNLIVFQTFSKAWGLVRSFVRNYHGISDRKFAWNCKFLTFHCRGFGRDFQVLTGQFGGIFADIRHRHVSFALLQTRCSSG